MSTTDNNLIALLEFESITPLWPGGPIEAKTFKCIGAKCIGPFLPDSKQLIGRIRWLLRTVQASVLLLTGKAVESYKNVEKLSSKIFGSTKNASKIRILVEYEPSTLSDKEYIRRESLQPLEAIQRRKGKSVDIFMSLEVEGFRLIRREELGLPDHIFLSGKSQYRHRNFLEALKRIGRSEQKLKDIYMLTTIPRVRLAFQGKRPLEFYEAQPLKPGIKMRISIYSRAGAKLASTEKELVVLATLFTLSFIGLGKATTRGFGRFKLVNYKLTDSNTAIKKTLEAYRKLFDSPETLCSEFRNSGKRLIELAARILNKNNVAGLEEAITSTEQIESLLRKTSVPALIIALSKMRCVSKLVHPCPYSTQELSHGGLRGCKSLEGGAREVKSILAALSAIGKATLKSTWKYFHIASRANIENFNNRIKDIKYPGVMYHTWTLGLPRGVEKVETGYYLTEEPFKEEECGYSLRQLGVSIRKDVRRLSPTIITVACSQKVCFALLEPFFTYKDFENCVNKLVHVGRHNRYEQTYHVVNVDYAARRRSLGDSECPKDPGGIAFPEKIEIVQGDTSSIIESLDSSLEWLETLLSA